ncbi:MAG: hypothetical protein JKX98_01550 [Alcanivoracaceae bacterium]|nr:hypothetical protein [Alcanivoracaceae bacterium]
MLTQNMLFTLRRQWFQLQAKNFILRYSTGLMVLAMFLPGVAIGDNFNLFMSAITKPFVLISQSQTPFLIKLVWLLVLQIVFIVWARAQRYAINGGNFAIYLQTLPIDKRIKNQNNIFMLLLSNHLLWPVIFAGFYHLLTMENTQLITAIFRYGFLVLLLLTTQYISVFSMRTFSVLTVVGLSIGLLVSIKASFVLILILFWLLVWFFARLLKSQGNYIKPTDTLRPINIFPKFLSHNLYYQILFKSALTSTLFRLAIIVFLIFGFSLIAQHFANINDNNLFPYSLSLEALLAYYISGFFVSFNDERQQMKQLLSSLPVKKSFWLVRDVLVIFLLSSLIHLPFYSWQHGYFTNNTLWIMFLYHLLLLLLCYPIRVFIKNRQTFISFVVLFIITAITIYHIEP